MIADKTKILKELAEKYGLEPDIIEQMVSIYPTLSLRDHFKDTKEEFIIAQIIDDKPNQAIPVDKCQFEVEPDEIAEIVDGDKTIQVIYKRALILGIMTGSKKGTIYSRIPSSSENMGLVKIEYNRKCNDQDLTGAIIKITETSFIDKTGVKRDGYMVQEILPETLETQDETKQIDSK